MLSLARRCTVFHTPITGTGGRGACFSRSQKSDVNLNQFLKLFFAQRGLAKDSFQQRKRDIFRMDWDSHTKFRLRVVEQPGMATSLMVNVKAASQERANYFLGFEDGKFFCHRTGKP